MTEVNEQAEKQSENVEKTEHTIIIDNDKIKIEIVNDEIKFTLTNGVSYHGYVKAYKYEEITGAIGLSDCKDLKEVFNKLIDSEFKIKKETNQIIVNNKEITLEKVDFTDKDVIQLLTDEVNSQNKIIAELREQNAKLENDYKTFREEFEEFERNSRYKEEINLIYDTKEVGTYNIFGEKFVEKNKSNIDLIINGKDSELIKECKLKEGENNITIKLKKRLTNLDYMFYGCDHLKNIDELEFLNTKYCNSFSYMFHGCKLLSDLKALEQWSVSRGTNFSNMFYRCLALSNIKALENWNVSKNTDFSHMFYGCSSLADIKPLENWDVSNGSNFSSMFFGCKLLTDIKSLENWNVSNGKNFSLMLCGCKSLPDLKSLEKWKLEKSLLENIS